MREDRLKYLIGQYENQECTEAEWAELQEWFRSIQMGSRSMHDWLAESGSEEQFTDDSFKRFSQKLNSSRSFSSWKRWVGVAASLLIIAAAGLLFFRKPTVTSTDSVQVHKSKSGNNASITLEDGSIILLNEQADGKLKGTGKANITRVGNGKAVYTGHKNTYGSSELVYHTLTTPRGGKYDLVLPDGTEVIVDAASSITYPINFSGPERIVEVKGQAYFKVVHNVKQPFIVKAGGQVLRDIGTEFNVSAYYDEAAMQATLVEGSISISNAANSKVLKPGQQASVINGQNIITIKKPNMDDVLAWTKGNFTFHHQQITDILRQAARWYDIEVVYEGMKPNKTFGGTLKRDKDVNELLESLRILGRIKYKLIGRRVIIMN